MPPAASSLLGLLPEAKVHTVCGKAEARGRIAKQSATSPLYIKYGTWKINAGILNKSIEEILPITDNFIMIGIISILAAVLVLGGGALAVVMIMGRAKGGGRQIQKPGLHS